MTLCIILPKMSGYVKIFDETKYMSFLYKDFKNIQKHPSDKTPKKGSHCVY